MYEHESDAIAMSAPTMCDPFRANVTLSFEQGWNDDETEHADNAIAQDGPVGAREFAEMWAAFQLGVQNPRLDSIMSIRIGARGKSGKHSPAAQRQMMGILRWLLACNGHGEDVLQDAIVLALESHTGPWTNISVGEVMAHTPMAMEMKQWCTPPAPMVGQQIPLEWLE